MDVSANTPEFVISTLYYYWSEYLLHLWNICWKDIEKRKTSGHYRKLVKQQWWARRDLNTRYPPYQSGAITRLCHGPLQEVA